MPSSNEELQKIEDEYFSQRFEAELSKLFSFRTLKTVLALLAFIAVYSLSITNAFHFYPSDWGIDVGLGLSGMLALCFMMKSALRQPNKPDSDNAAKGPKPLRLLLGGILIAVFFTPITFNFCLGFATEMIGTPGQQHAIEKSWRTRGRRYCAGPVIQGVWLDMNIICVDRARKNEFPAGSHLTLKGKVSPLGMIVDDAMPHW